MSLTKTKLGDLNCQLIQKYCPLRHAWNWKKERKRKPTGRTERKHDFQGGGGVQNQVIWYFRKQKNGLQRFRSHQHSSLNSVMFV